MQIGVPRRLTPLGGVCSDAVFGPDGRKIAFCFNVPRHLLDIYLMNHDGTDVSRLTKATKECSFFDPQFSPDGRHLLYAGAHATDMSIRLFLLDLEEGTTRPLGEPCVQTRPFFFPDARYSPDGQHIVFTWLADGAQEIFRMSADGREWTRLTYSDHPRLVGRTRPRNETPSYSPDGQHIVFASTAHAEPGEDRHQVYLMRADGSGQTRLTDTEGKVLCPLWHPGGKHIAFIGFTPLPAWDRKKGDIFLVDMDGTNLRGMEQGEFTHMLGSFSPDGQHLAFASTRHGRLEEVTNSFDVYLWDLASDQVQQVTDNEVADEMPAFSPDGKALMFISRRDGHQGLYMADVLE